jgi:choline dehydrogenase-like flavoprotein
MIVDARDQSVALDHETPIAIVGAGAAGITLALAFAEKGIRCLVLEAGGERLDHTAQKFYRAASISPHDHGPVHQGRRRVLGGTTAIWGGRCIPFDPIDFEDRRWIPYARWPVTYEDVARYYPKALELCQAGPALFQAGEALPGSSPMLVDGVTSADVILDRIERFSEPTHFGRRYRERLAASREVTVLLHANALEITVDASNGRVSGVLAATTKGRRLKVSAKKVIVANGALETARLLLASRSVCLTGVGNAAGLVGRFYQSHFEGGVGEIQFHGKPWDSRFDYERSPENVYCRRYIWLSPTAQRRDHLGGLVVRPHHRKIADPAHGSAVLSAMYLVKDLIAPEYGRPMSSAAERAATAHAAATRAAIYVRHLTNIVRGSPALTAFAVDWIRRRTLATRKLPSVVLRNASNRYVLDINAEQIPNPDSRVYLSSENDALGMPRLHIDWRTTPLDREMVARGLRVLQAAFADGSRQPARNGATITFDDQTFERQVGALTRVGGHHIGTARMGRSRDEGVVNADGEAFDIRGLFIAGAATFPTSGFANPTLVIVALALRLADHLAGTRD